MKFIIVNNILYDYHGSSLMLGGIESYIQELSILIDELGYEVKIIQKSHKDFENVLCGSIVVTGISGKNGMLPTNKNFLNYVKSNCENSVVIWGSDQLSTKLRNTKSIVIQHGIGFDCEAFESGFRRFIPLLNLNKFYKFMQRYRAIRLFENSNNAVCVDYNFLCWYRTMRPSKASNLHRVIPNFTRLPEKKICKNSDGYINIVFARRFVTRRGIDIFLPAIDKLMRARKNVKVTFAGGGGRLNEVEKFCAGNSNASISSYQYDESLYFHSKFDIAVVPSIGSEGTSLSLLEAMSAGCSVVATNVGGLTNIIIDNFNGVLVNPNSNELYLAMLKLVDSQDLRERLAINSVQVVNSSFSINIWKSRWTKVINEVIKCDSPVNNL